MAANLRIIHANHVDTATVTASSSASASLGVANLLTDIKSSVWRSIGTSARLDVLLASAAIVSGIALPFTNLSSAAVMRVRATNEQAATNLLSYPRNFDNAAHQTPVGLTLAPKSVIAPDDQMTGYMVLETAANGLHAQDLAAVPFVNGTTYTFSMVVKPIGRHVALYLPATLFTGRFAVFDTANGVVLNAAPGVTARISYCQNGWFRCSVTETCINTASSRPTYMSYNGGISFAGDATKGLCVWHAQVEAGQNVLTAPNEFDNPAHSAPLNLAVGARNILAPDNSTTGTSMLETAATGMHAQDLAPVQFTSGAAYTLSIAAKPIGNRQFALYFPGSLFTGRFAVFDLVNGTVVTSAPGVTARISYSQNGWYRCSITEVCAASGTARGSYFSYNGGLSFAGDPTKGLNVWQARVEVGGVGTSVIPDATAFVSRSSSKWVFDASGTLVQVPANVAAFDYDPVTRAARGVSLEAGGANLLLRSAELDHSSWGKTAVSIAANAVAAPDGTAGMDTITHTSTSTALMQTTGAFTAGSTITVSVYAKKGVSNFLRFEVGNACSAWFNLNTGTAASNSAGAGNVLFWSKRMTHAGNGVYRCELTVATTAVTAVQVNIQGTDTDNNPASVGSSISVWGAQAEVGYYATSYVPTTASMVTRAADISTSPQVTRQVGYIDGWQSYDYDSFFLAACPGGVRDVWGWVPAQLNVASYGFGGGNCARRWMPKTMARAIAIDISDPGNASGYIEASRLVIGDYWSPEHNADYGAQQTPVDNSTHDRSDAGDQRVIPGSMVDGITFNMQWLVPDDRAEFAKILRRNGTRVPMFVSLYPDSSDPAIEADFQVYGRLSSLGALTAHTYGYHSAPLAIDQI